ncbi:MAG: hypothetical protein PHI84_22170 [Kiritimatiellae bacterium]|nr:hypothetical protein [Kiritimatiellia bacterium]
MASTQGVEDPVLQAGAAVRRGVGDDGVGRLVCQADEEGLVRRRTA